MRLKSLSATSTFKVFRIFYFAIFAQFPLDSFCFVWKQLNLKLSRRPYCSRSSNFLPFNLSCVSKDTILSSCKETPSLSLAMVSSFVVTFSFNFAIFNPNSFDESLWSFISIFYESISSFDTRHFTASSNRF